MEATWSTFGLRKAKKALGWVFLVSILLSGSMVYLMLSDPDTAKMDSPGMDPSMIVEEPPPDIDGSAEEEEPVVGAGLDDGAGSNDGESRDPRHPPPDYDDSTIPSGLDTVAIVSIIALLTSLISLIGFFGTTILAWKKDKREALASALAVKKTELEVEKLRRELETSKDKSDGNV